MSGFNFGDFFSGVGDWAKENPDLIGGGIGALIGAQGGDDQTTTQTPYLYPGQGEGIANVINLAGEEYQNGPQQYYPGNPIAGLDQNLIDGQNSQLGTVGVQQQLADQSAFGTADLLQGGAGRIEGFNLPDQVGFGIDQGLENAVMNPIMDQLTQKVLPGLDLQATNQGAFGGTRHSLMKGQAASDAIGQASDSIARANLQARQQSIGQRGNDINAMLSGRGQDINQNQLYNSAVGAGLNATPGAMANQLAPGQIQQDIGKARTTYDQALIDADKARFDFNQQAPMDALSRLQQRMTLQAPGGSVTTTPGQAGGWLGALGGGLAGSQLGGMFAGTGGATNSNPLFGANTDQQFQDWGIF